MAADQKKATKLTPTYPHPPGIMELLDKGKLKAQFWFSAVPFILVTADDRGLEHGNVNFWP